MSKTEVTGMTKEEIPELEKEFEGLPASDWYEFEERYCLYKIPYQPEEYDGPPRYCKNKASKNRKTGYYRCRFHRNRGGNMEENLTPGNGKHYMYASEEYLLDHLTDEEQELYEQIISWAEVYGIDPDEEPAAYDSLTLLAKQRVREVKASKYIFDEGEIRDKLIYDQDGNVILDDNGEPITEDDSNVISDEYRQLIKLIESLKKDLIMTRKEQAKAGDRKVQSDAAETASKAFSELVDDEDKKFDVDDY